ncbi:hypothetical protein GE09DRAFT_341374 [Coniochaeta sp. 2T2.1]|nr:hypothetical protein GE09DRAFT_341374 [Coniochaeta sp. 2T2.1]
MLSNFIFNQTEYVYTFLSRVGVSEHQNTIEQLMAVYQTCLESYEKITNFLKEQGDSFPCTLFAHIYFHFCLLALFRPFINYGIDVAGTSPRVVCAEAVQAILDVTQSYASLFTLRRTPCFVPYFMFAAGLTRIGLESESTAGTSPSASSALGLSPATGTTGSTGGRSPSVPAVVDESGDAFMTGNDSGQASFSPPTSATTRSTSATTRSTSITMTTGSAVSDEDLGLTQAVQQLEAMSVGHPAAAQAGWVLRDFKAHQPDSR